MSSRPSDTIELGELGRAVARGKWWIPTGVLLGVVVAVAVNAWAPPRYETSATVVLRDRSDGGGTLPFQQMLGAGAGEGGGGGIAGLLSLPGLLQGSSQTELAILGGRALLEEAADSMGLQVTVLRPLRTPASALFSEIRPDRRASRATYRFRERDGGWRVSGPGAPEGTFRSGEEVRIGESAFVLQEAGLPSAFTIRLESRWEVVDRIRRRGILDVSSPGGDLAEVTVRWRDAETASGVANLLVALYLEDRLDRLHRVTSERLALLEGVRDSIRGDLQRVTDEFRAFHEREGSFDPDRLGDLERVAELRAEVDQMEVEARSLDDILTRIDTTGSLGLADILAYPTFLDNELINDLLGRLTELRQERATLLERRTPRDPDVMVLQENIEGLESELISLARSYRSGLGRNLTELQGELSRYRQEFARRPLQEATEFELEQELERVGATYIGVQAQLVQARLDAIGEGTDLRQVDVAAPPTRPWFPRPLLNVGLGILGGLLVGLVVAGTSGFRTRRIHDAAQVSRRTGLAAIRLDGGRPLLLGGAGEGGVLGVLPVTEHGEAGAAARRVHEALKAQGRNPVLVDPVGNGDMSALRGLLDDAEGNGRIAVVPLSHGTGPTTETVLRDGRKVLLVAREGTREMGRIEEAAEELERGGVRVVGVILVEGQGRRPVGRLGKGRSGDGRAGA